MFLFDLGYFKIHALARIAAAGAYFLTRLNHQTNLFTAGAGGMQPLALAQVLKTVEGNIFEQHVFLGTQELVRSRLIAVRMPEAIVNERRRIAKKKAKKKGDTPSKSQLLLLAWNLFISNVPSTIWHPETIVKGYPIRWQVELIFKSWKRYCPVATLNAKKADTVLCSLYGRLLLILINYALYPPVRGALWVKKHRALSVLKLVRHFQALADTWRHVILQGELALRRFLHRVCARAERLAAKAARKRRTTGQTLRESLRPQPESIEVAAVADA